jgi:DNA polymerase III alpha subunit
MEDASAMKLDVLGPDVNESHKFSVNKDHAVPLGMGAIKVKYGAATIHCR